MAKNTSIYLGDFYEQVVQKAINTGKYSTASEVVRAGLRMLNEYELERLVVHIPKLGINEVPQPQKTLRKRLRQQVKNQS